MRQLTFGGFLTSYVKFLSGESTLSQSRLVALLPSQPRLVEPLLLWATVTDRSERRARLLAENHRLLAELRLLVSLKEDGLLEEAISSDDPRLRPKYVKAWRSYTARRDASARDARRKLVARERVLKLEAEKGVSRYRMAKDLGLNPGNLHAFLSVGDTRKLALEKAYQLVEYLEAA
jgi:hypothetical protein